MNSKWYVVYKGKSAKGSISESLDAKGVEHFTPTVVRTKLNNEGDAYEEKVETMVSNLMFVRTDGDIRALVNETEGLRYPMIDCATRLPAVVSDSEMQRFKEFLEIKNINARILEDPFSRFKVCQKVRVGAGKFQGLEGYVFRIRGDRKLVVSLGNMAVAISGIHHSLLEPIDESN